MIVLYSGCIKDRYEVELRSGEYIIEIYQNHLTTASSIPRPSSSLHQVYANDVVDEEPIPSASNDPYVAGPFSHVQGMKKTSQYRDSPQPANITEQQRADFTKSADGPKESHDQYVLSSPSANMSNERLSHGPAVNEAVTSHPLPQINGCRSVRCEEAGILQRSSGPMIFADLALWVVKRQEMNEAIVVSLHPNAVK